MSHKHYRAYSGRLYTTGAISYYPLPLVLGGSMDVMRALIDVGVIPRFNHLFGTFATFICSMWHSRDGIPDC
jgi:hypothetical protein